MKTHYLATIAVIIAAKFSVSESRAQDAASPDVPALIKRIDELEQKVKILERNRELDQDASTEKAKTTPTVSLGMNGLIVRSGDSNFVMDLHGYAQADARYYLDHKTVPDTFLLRRVRPIVEGSVYDKFDYRLMADLATGNGSGSSTGNNALLDDAYVNARLWPDLQIQVGKFKSPVGLERLQSTAELLFVETGFATQMTPNYDLGAAIHNTLWNSPINYSIGIFNGAADNASDDADVNDEGKDIVGRLFFQPFVHSDTESLQKLGFGVGGSYGTHSGPLPSYKTPGQQTFFAYASGVTANGEQYRVDPQAYYYWGPFGILGEYILSHQTVSSTNAGTSRTHFNNTAWQVEGTYFLTGEENSFKASSLKHVVPVHPFSLGGGWGAFELVARVGQLSLDRAAFPLYVTPASAREATSWGVGLNWYFNSNVKLNLDFESTSFRGGSSAATSATANDEHAILSRVQFSF